MAKKGSKLSVLTMSVLAACSMVFSYLPTVTAAMHYRHVKRTSLHFDVGVQGNVGFSSGYYTETEPGTGVNLFNDANLHFNQGPKIFPAAFAGIRYYINRLFIGLQVGGIFLQRGLGSLHYFDEYSVSSSNITLNEVHVKLASRNALYGKLSLGHFVTPDTSLNLNVLGFYGRCRLTYDVTGFADDVDTEPQTLSLRRKEKMDLIGYGLGMGVEHYLSNHFSVSVDYTFVGHNSVNKKIMNNRVYEEGDTLWIALDPTFGILNFGDLHESILSLSLTYEV
jgi:hypothetical protein